jgi:hypothetical protein
MPCNSVFIFEKTKSISDYDKRAYPLAIQFKISSMEQHILSIVLCKLSLCGAS